MLEQAATTAGRLAEKITRGLALNDSLGIAVLFALQASLCSLGTLWLAMWLQLDSPYWAASTVLITAQATRSQSLLKAINRIVGTLVGITAAIVIVALFPQHWWSFATALSGWIALCTFIACLLRSLQAYAAALSGYTAVIVLTESFGDPNGAFTVALSRGSTVVLGVTMYSITALLLIPARGSKDLRVAFEDMFTKVRDVAAAVLRGDGNAAACAKLMARYPEFDEKIEEAVTDGLWPPGTRAGMRRATLAMADLLVLSFEASQRSARRSDSRTHAAAEIEATTGRRDIHRALARLEGERDSLASSGSISDRSAAASLSAMAQARAGLALLRTGIAPATLGKVRRTVHREYVAAGYAALRAFAGMMLAFSFWIITRWPHGDSFVLIVGILCCLFATRPEPITLGLRFTIGTMITTVLALVIGFFLIPRMGTFPGLAACLLPTMLIGTFGLKSKVLSPYCTPMNFFLVAMIGIQNRMQYSPPDFFNSSLAIFAGCCTGVLMFELLPPLSNGVQASILRRWIRLQAHRTPPHSAERREEWRIRLYDRLGLLISKLPPEAQADTFRRTVPVAVRLQGSA